MKAYLVSRPSIVASGLESFLTDHAPQWFTTAQSAAETLCEVAGRLCYMSFAKGRKTNSDFLANIIKSGHHSVLEHANWGFVLTGVSRSLTHELVRHRHFSVSQLSQRFVDESKATFIEPDGLAGHPELHQQWLKAVEQARAVYIAMSVLPPEGTTLQRKRIREAARSVLPNATETKIFVTGNARSWRHFIELRTAEGADVEIQAVAREVLRQLAGEAPNLFGDLVRQTVDLGGKLE